MAGLLATVTGCGGGGGGGGTPTDTPTPPPPPPPPPPPDKYEASSYSSDGTSNQSLTGLWMMLEDNHTKTTSLPTRILDVTRQRRSLINITDHGNGSATIVHCVDTGGVAQSTVPVNGSILQFYLNDGLNLQATIVNNQRLQGQVISASANVQVLSSAVTLVKIDDTGSLPGGDPVGSASVKVTDNGAPLNDFANQAIHCFSQQRYESERTVSGVVERFEGNYVEFTSLLNAPADLSTASYLGSAIYYGGSASTSSPDVELFIAAPSFMRYDNEQDPTVNVTTDTLEQVVGRVTFKDESRPTIAADVQFTIEL